MIRGCSSSLSREIPQGRIEKGDLAQAETAARRGIGCAVFSSVIAG
jgi:hypothetical protein